MHWCDSVIHQQLNLTIQQLQLTMFRQANTGKKYGNEQFQWQLLCFCVTDVHARLCATAYCIQYICNCVSSRQTAGLRKVFWHVDLTQSCHRRKVELYDLFPCSYRALFRPALDAVSSCRHRPVVLHSQLGAQSDWHLSSYPPPPPHPNTHTHMLTIQICMAILVSDISYIYEVIGSVVWYACKGGGFGSEGNAVAHWLEGQWFDHGLIAPDGYSLEVWVLLLPISSWCLAW